VVASRALVSCLAYTSTLKMEAICSSETSVDFQRATRRYIPEDRTLPGHTSFCASCGESPALLLQSTSSCQPQASTASLSFAFIYGNYYFCIPLTCSFQWNNSLVIKVFIGKDHG
jgi:hypothetical protein